MEKADLLFWTDIFLDHAIFQINAFSPKEGEYIGEAEKFYYIFKKWNKAIASGEGIDMRSLENDATAFVSFKKTIIYELLQHNILINFSPSFINHMVNEGNEFLNMFKVGSCSSDTKRPSTYIKGWLIRFYDHASTLAAYLDSAEKPTIQRLEMFTILFDKLIKNAAGLEMIRDNMNIALETSLLQEEAISLIEEFIVLCEEIGKLLDAKRIMGIGTLSSALTSHFNEEHRYCINKIKTCM